MTPITLHHIPAADARARWSAQFRDACPITDPMGIGATAEEAEAALIRAALCRAANDNARAWTGRDFGDEA